MDTEQLTKSIGLMHDLKELQMKREALGNTGYIHIEYAQGRANHEKAHLHYNEADSQYDMLYTCVGEMLDNSIANTKGALLQLGINIQ